MSKEIPESRSQAGPASFQPHPEHAESVREAIASIQQLALEQPEFGKQLRAMDTTEDVRQALQNRGITISCEALWRHRGSFFRDGQPTWRG
jgi:hypothetical protein